MSDVTKNITTLTESTLTPADLTGVKVYAEKNGHMVRVPLGNMLGTGEFVTQVAYEENNRAVAQAISDVGTASAQAVSALTTTVNEKDTATNERIDVLDTKTTSIATKVGSTPAVLVPTMIQSMGGRGAFKHFIQWATSSDVGYSLTAACEEFFANATDCRVYTSQFYCYNVSGASFGEKMDDNANLVCEPSTDTVAGRDDYADLALFMPIDVNYKIDELTLEPIITAVSGISPNFSLTHPDGLVGVMQMTGWVHKYNDGTNKGIHYSSARVSPDYVPLPEAVRALDNSVRPFVIHAKYPMSLTDDELPTSASGRLACIHTDLYKNGQRVNTSHDGQISMWRKLGNQYSGGSICDINFLQMMVELKYAKLSSYDVVRGSVHFSHQFTATVSETGVSRFLIPSNQTSTFVVGARVSVGIANAADGSKDRYHLPLHSIVSRKKISSIETVTIDGTNYVAINIDTNGEVFDVEAGVTILSSMPWHTGSTDTVLGNDGSMGSYTTGKYPAKIQGIEYALGFREALADTVVDYREGYAHFQICRLAKNVRAGNIGIDSFELPDPVKCPENDSGHYVAETNNSVEGYGIPKEYGATNSTGYKAYIYLKGETFTGLREYLAIGELGSGSGGGVLYSILNYSLANTCWSIGGRASGTAGNRGEFGA